MNMSIFQQVSAMNLAFNNPFGGASNDRLEKQSLNLQKEYEELLRAIRACDRIETRDAACDILVFALGDFHLMGVDYDKSDAEIEPNHRWPVLSHIPDESVFEALEIHAKTFPELYPNLMIEIPKIPYMPEYPFLHVIQPLHDIIAFAKNIHALLGEDITADMNAVYESNMSKFCKTEAEVQATIEKYDAIGVVNVYTEGDFPTMCIKSGEDQNDTTGDFHPKGKFLKGINYKKPVFA